MNYSSLLTAKDSYRWSQKNKSRVGTISNRLPSHNTFLRLLSLVFELRLGQYAKTRQNKSPAYAPTGSKLDVNYHELGLFCIHQPMNANVVVSQFNKLFTFLLVLFVYVGLGDWNVFPRNAIIVCHCYKQIYGPILQIFSASESHVLRNLSVICVLVPQI